MPPPHSQLTQRPRKKRGGLKDTQSLSGLLEAMAFPRRYASITITRMATITKTASWAGTGRLAINLTISSTLASVSSQESALPAGLSQRTEDGTSKTPHAEGYLALTSASHHKDPNLRVFLTGQQTGAANPDRIDLAPSPKKRS